MATNPFLRFLKIWSAAALLIALIVALAFASRPAHALVLDGGGQVADCRRD